MVPGNGSTYGRLREVWDLLDRPEVALLCLEDHLLSITDDSEAYQFECWAVLAAMAERTSGPLISALVSPAALRNPAVTAKAAATVDTISGGRLMLGLGAGWYAKEFDFAGIPFPALPERLDRLRGMALRCREIWSDPGLQPMPAAPGIPIMVGGKGLTTTLPVVARVADAWNTEGPPALWRECNDALDRECRAAGRPAGAILRTVALEPDEIDLLPEYRAAGAELAIIVVRPSLRDDEIIDIIERARASFGAAAGAGAPGTRRT
jgi:alkanesulfonate monooxygenase SsuD/methylene tetrahydromethanopterin reductase-like flavin-dependent oxidoreductase (luciferase family)